MSNQDIPAEEFEPLDKTIAAEFERLHGDSVRQLTDYWAQGWEPRLSTRLRQALPEWRKGLTPARVSAYCSAAAESLCRALVKASTSDQHATGRLLDPGKDPRFEVSGAVLPVVHFARDIASYCAQELVFGELAWRFVAGALPDKDVPLAHLDVQHVNGVINIEHDARPG